PGKIGYNLRTLCPPPTAVTRARLARSTIDTRATSRFTDRPLGPTVCGFFSCDLLNSSTGLPLNEKVERRLQSVRQERRRGAAKLESSFKHEKYEKYEKLRPIRYRGRLQRC